MPADPTFRELRNAAKSDARLSGGGCGNRSQIMDRRLAGACIVELSGNGGRILDDQVPRVCYTIGAIFWALSDPVSPRGGSLVRSGKVRTWLDASFDHRRYYRRTGIVQFAHGVDNVQTYQTESLLGVPST